MVPRLLAAAALAILFVAGSASASGGGRLDPTFSGDGYFYSRQFFPNGQEYRPGGVEDLALQSDGKILAVGELEVSYGWAFGAYRFTAAGDLDRSFGEGGWVDTEVGDDFAWAHAVEVQRDGKIVVAGEAICPGLHKCAVLVRYLSNGSLDPSFGKGGIVQTVTRSRLLSASGLVIQRDGKLLVLAWNLLQKFVLARYLPDGRLDKTYSRDGFAIAGTDRAIGAFGLTLQRDGRALVVGVSERVGVTSSDFVIARFRRDGRLDRSFSRDGFQRVDFRRRDDAAVAVDVQRDGRIVVAGASTVEVKPARKRIALVRLNRNGTVDGRFGTRLTRPASGGTASAVLVRPDGRIIVAGVAYRDPWGHQTTRWLVAGYLANGRLDRSFGDQGFVLANFGTGDDSASSILPQPDGKLVVGGQIYMDDGLARYLPRRTGRIVVQDASGTDVDRGRLPRGRRDRERDRRRSAASARSNRLRADGVAAPRRRLAAQGAPARAAR
jgi:uncharacterized delta-60 repeat protein